MPEEGMKFEEARAVMNLALESLDSSPFGEDHPFEKMRQDLRERLWQAMVQMEEVENRVVPKSLFPDEGFAALREGLLPTQGSPRLYEYVWQSDARGEIEQFIAGIEEWARGVYESFSEGTSAFPSDRTPRDTRPDATIAKVDDLLQFESALESAINTASDTDDPCFDLLREWSERVWSKLREYRAYPIEDIHESYGYLAAQIEHLAVIAERVTAPVEMVAVINNLLDEIGGPWRDR